MLETIFKWIALAGKLAIASYLCPDFPTCFGQSLHSSQMDPLTNIRQIRSTQIPLTTFNHTAKSNILSMVYKVVLIFPPGHLIFYLFTLTHCTSPTLHSCSSISVFLWGGLCICCSLCFECSSHRFS